MILETNSTWVKSSMHHFSRWREKIATTIFQHRWLLLVLLGLFVLIFELLEGISNERPINAHFVRELVFFGAVYPVVTFWLLNKLFTAQAERNHFAWQQERSRQLKQALVKARDLETLHQTIVSFPETVAPTLGVALYRPIPNTNRLELAVERWQWGSERPLLLPPTITASSCGETKHSSANGLHPIPTTDVEEIAPQGYCLPLLRGDELAGLLNLYLAPMSKLTADQIAVFNQTAAAMALALWSVIPQNIEMIQASAARSERERISRHLHDTLGQKLAYLQLTLDNLAMANPEMDLSTVQQEFAQVRNVSNEVYEQVRQMLLMMRSEGQLNLSDGLVKQAKAVAETAKFDLTYTLEGRPYALSPLVERKILFVYREALHNIQRHARATAVALEIIWGDSCLDILLKDNGLGFNPNNDIPTGHFGLLIMAQRAQEINANLEITSARNQGTWVRLAYPLPDA